MRVNIRYNNFTPEPEILPTLTGSIEEEEIPESRFSGEAEKLGPEGRSGMNIFAGKPRVRSIMTPEEEEGRPGHRLLL